MFQTLKRRNFWIMLLTDGVIVALSYYLSYYLRFDGPIPQPYLHVFLNTIIWIIPLKLVSFFFFDLYKGMWRYTSVVDLINLLKACITASAIIAGILGITTRFYDISRGVFVIDFLLTFCFTGALRVGIRLMYQKRYSKHERNNHRDQNTPSKRLLIIGAGDAGEKLLREIRDNPSLRYRVIGLIDDDPQKMGRKIHNVAVWGDLNSLPNIVASKDVEEILIAVPSATGKQMRRITSECKATKLPFKTLPGMGELVNGRVSVKTLRDVNFKDLLGRPAVKLNMAEIQGYLKNRTVLVTGAGGSIGSELCRQIVRFGPERIILFDVSEPNLYSIEMELKYQWGYENYTTVLGDVRSELLLDRVFSCFCPEVVFHAAAYKHVPMLEQNPWQGIYNNILGTQTLLEQAVCNGTKNFVLVSTDKAVRPTNVMGASKRICELIAQAYLGNSTSIMAVRFGNVVGSAGSVIPLFRQQIEQGGPVTVTHPEVTRYFMTIAEATQLILQAGALGIGGEIFVLEMGTPVKIADMAKDLIRLSGKDPEQDIEIVFTGLRPGEKLYEELITEGENILATKHEKIMVLKPHREGDEFRERLSRGIEELKALADAHDAEGIKEQLKELVPEYEPQRGDKTWGEKKRG